MHPNVSYMDPMLEEAEDHATDATPDYVEDSDIYAGSESESTESHFDSDEVEELFEEEEEEDDMEMDD